MGDWIDGMMRRKRGKRGATKKGRRARASQAGGSKIGREGMETGEFVCWDVYTGWIWIWIWICEQ